MEDFIHTILNFKPKMPPILYHYCSVETMFSILQNYTVWLSDMEQMNDKTELKYFCDIIDIMLHDILDSFQGKYESDLLNVVRDVLEEQVSNVRNRLTRLTYHTKNYSCCFSENGDLLSQWRAYGDDGHGVAIGFNTELIASISNMLYCDFVKVIYDDKEIFNNLKRYMKESLECALTSIMDDNSSLYVSDDKLDIQNVLFNLSAVTYPFTKVSYPFKHPAFKEENEWRLYRGQTGNFDDDIDADQFLSPSAFCKQDMDIFSFSELKFRAVRGNICSYYELNFNNCKDSIIKHIILGPKCKIKEIDLKILLKKYNYISSIKTKEIPIEPSNAPYV